MQSHNDRQEFTITSIDCANPAHLLALGIAGVLLFSLGGVANEQYERLMLTQAHSQINQLNQELARAKSATVKQSELVNNFCSQWEGK